YPTIVIPIDRHGIENHTGCTSLFEGFCLFDTLLGRAHNGTLFRHSFGYSSSRPGAISPHRRSHDLFSFSEKAMPHEEPVIERHRRIDSELLLHRPQRCSTIGTNTAVHERNKPNVL